MMEQSSVPTIEQVFGGMDYVLHRVQSCKLARISGNIWEKSDWLNLLRHVWDLPRKEAVQKIDQTLEQIDVIRGMGETIYKNLSNEIIENAYHDDETGAPTDYDNREESKSICNYFLLSVKEELETVREKLTSHSSDSSRPEIERIKFNLSVDEVAIFFRLLEEVKVIPPGARVSVGKMLSDYVVYKGGNPSVSVNSVSNRMGDYRLNYKKLENVKDLLIKMINAATSLQQK